MPTLIEYTVMKKKKMSPITKRLMPLYIAAFFQGIPFWYAIEKLFMVEIGFNLASIGLMVAIMSVVMLVVETPSGILADRWSRKGVMILGCVALTLSAIVGAASYNEVVYIISTILWGVYAALYSGTYDSVMYDTVLEEHGDSKKFEYYLGRFRAVEGASFVVGSLLGGLISSLFTMRLSYILSVPLIMMGLFFLIKFREPVLHKSEVNEPVFKHIRQTFAAVLKTPVLLPVVIATVGFSLLLETVFELNQLWFIAVAAPLALYGVFSAAIFSSWTTGGMVASRFKSKMFSYFLIFMTLISLTGLIVSRDYWVILVWQVGLAVSLVALGVMLAKKLHDELPSRLRAGSASVVSTLARLLLIPGSLLIAAIANQYSIFKATYVLLAVAIVASVSFLLIKSRRPA